jgi:hypothetical protein
MSKNTEVSTTTVTQLSSISSAALDSVQGGSIGGRSPFTDKIVPTRDQLRRMNKRDEGAPMSSWEEAVLARVRKQRQSA